MELQEYRVARVKEAAKRAGISAVVATTPSNVRYLTGYCGMLENFQHESFTYVLCDIRNDRMIYIASLGEVPTILENDIGAEVFASGSLVYEYNRGDSLSDHAETIYDRRYSSMEEALASAVNTVEGSVAIDEGCMNFASFGAVRKKTAGHELLPAYDIFMEARRVKHPDEIEGLRQAAETAEKSLQEALRSFRAGVTTEKDLERRYNECVIKNGALPLFFVASSGKRSAFCDTVTADRIIREGEIVRFDFGCIRDGYRSDIARTAVAGKPDEKICTFYKAVKEGTRRAVEAMKPGMTVGEIFKIAQETTRESGLPFYRRHHTGHGIGLEMYDIPSVTPGNALVLEENMVFCIETPYYELGWGGVQVEDTVVVTANGAEYLAPPSGELIIL